MSRSAVSRTFTHGSSVSAETRARVLKAAEELNYHVNHLARGLSKEESRPICLLVSTLGKPYHAELLNVLTQKLQLAGRVVILINVGDDPQNAHTALEQTLNYRAAATVVLSGSPPTEMVEKCVAAGQRVILVNRSEMFEGTHSIGIDYQSAMEQAASMFHRAGCTSIAIVTRQKSTPSLRAREAALAAAAEALGISTSVWMGEATTYDQGRVAAHQLLSSVTPPDGVFCTTDLMACGFMDSARNDMNMAIPGDICVVGFDDIQQSAWDSYNLTTFAQPLPEIADAVLELINHSGAESAESVVLPARPVWRQSIRPAERHRI